MANLTHPIVQLRKPIGRNQRPNITEKAAHEIAHMMIKATILFSKLDRNLHWNVIIPTISTLAGLIHLKL